MRHSTNLVHMWVMWLNDVIARLRSSLTHYGTFKFSVISPKRKKISSLFAAVELTVISITLANDDGRVCASFEIVRLMKMSERTGECIRRFVRISTHLSIGHKPSLNPPSQSILSLFLLITSTSWQMIFDSVLQMTFDPASFFSIITPTTVVEQMVTWSLSTARLWLTAAYVSLP